MESKIAKVLEYEGVMAPPFTAYDNTGKVNIEVIPKYIEYLSRNGVTGLFVNGSTGDALSLSLSERKLLAEHWIVESKHIKMKMVVIHVASNCIQETKELAQHAEALNADAISVLPPIYYRPNSHDELISYLAEVASAAPNTPLIYYHNPLRSGVNVSLTSFVGEAQKRIPNFCGAKYASTDIKDLLTCQASHGQTFKLMIGCGEIFLSALPFGINSTMGITNNIMAPLSIEVLDSFNGNQMHSARMAQNGLNKFMENLTKHGSVFQVLRTAMNMLTPINIGNPRSPIYPLNKESQNALEEEITKILNSRWEIPKQLK